MSNFTNEELQEKLSSSKTWNEFKLRCGVPLSHSSTQMMAYLNTRDLKHDHLPQKEFSQVDLENELLAIPEVIFRDNVAAATNWAELLHACGYDNFNSIGVVRLRIRQLGIDWSHLCGKKQQPVVDEQQPVVDEQQPVVDEQQPVVDEQQPVVDEQQPVVDEQQPVVDEQQPAPLTEEFLGQFTDVELQNFLYECTTWVAFKLKTGIPRSYRQDPIRDYCDNHNLDYSHLPQKNQSGVQIRNEIWAIPEEEFKQNVINAKTWTELLDMCGCENQERFSIIRRRIRELNIDWSHLHGKKERKQKLTMEEMFSEYVTVNRNILHQTLVTERGDSCQRCENTIWQGYPIRLEVLHKNRLHRDNRRENLLLLCPNCAHATKMDMKKMF